MSFSVVRRCSLAIPFVFVACSSEGTGSRPQLIGTVGTGGGIASTGGSAVGVGGTTSTGGTTGSGGAPAKGGAPAVGGSTAGGVTGGGGTSPTSGGAGGGGPGGSAGAGASGAAGAGAGGGGGSVGNLPPIIPEISGDCPQFTAGRSTVTVMGSSATVIAGEQKQGTGSLLFYFYGTGKLGDVSFLPQAVVTDINAAGGIVFALNQSKLSGGDCSGTNTWGIDDFKVTDQVAACAVKNYGIDPKRIYATGCSAGGLFTGCMGIMRSNYIAAVAPNSGGVTIGYGKLQDPMRVPNVITMNGGAGDNVIVNFGQTSEGYDNYILKYGGFAVNCIHNMGHCGAPAALYQSAWQFLKDHPFGTKPSPYANGLPSGFHSSCKIFTMTSTAPIGGF